VVLVAHSKGVVDSLQSIDNLKPAVRQRWLAEHRLPPEVSYLSIGLQAPHKLLDRIHQRNDGNLLAMVDADHWAVMSNLRDSPIALVEAALRQLEEQLADGTH
jgi:hypothetical protein